jgi:hypothetical protein
LLTILQVGEGIAANDSQHELCPGDEQRSIDISHRELNSIRPRTGQRREQQRIRTLLRKTSEIDTTQ